jgi:hypothetical protein
MKIDFHIPFYALLLISTPATAIATETTTTTESEPIKCYQKAWESPEKGGLGLAAGQAVTLCSGATNANRVVQCYVKAWEHPANGGLGLTAGQAVTLCKTNSLQ